MSWAYYKDKYSSVTLAMECQFQEAIAFHPELQLAMQIIKGQEAFIDAFMKREEELDGEAERDR